MQRSLTGGEIVEDSYSQDEKKTILEKAPCIMGVVGPKTAEKLLKIAEEDKDYYFHSPLMVVGYETAHARNLRYCHCYNASGVSQPHSSSRSRGCGF
jgi:hypothetical protein